MQKKRLKLWALYGLLIQSMAVGALASSSQAATSAPQAASSSDDDYNFSWLDPEKKIYVLQNRKYRKAGGAHLYVMGGTALAETYRTAFQVQPRLATWFNEDFGFEAFYTARFSSPNNAYKALMQASGGGTTPLIREIKSQFGILFNWAPWYAKINVFDTVMYFDWYFSLGAGSMSTEIGPKTKDDNPSLWQSENLFAVYLGTGQIFHVSEVFKVRLDFLGHFYSAPIFPGIANAPADKSIFSSFTFSLGVGFKL
jgi:outer membrane beta-barrel protein